MMIYTNTVEMGTTYLWGENLFMEYYNPKFICKKLLFEMCKGVFSECKKLPRETELAEYLGISRTQLRDVLAKLEREGFITRKLGVGTLINHHVVQVKNRMDIETEFMDIIRNNGYVAGVRNIRVIEDIADDILASKLDIPKGTEILKIYRTCTADGKPVIYCEDVIEKSIIKNEYTSEDFKPSIFNFLLEHCGIKVYMDLTRISAESSDVITSRELEVEMHTPLLVMDEIDYDFEGKVIFYSKQYFISGAIEQTVIRMKLQ